MGRSRCCDSSKVKKGPWSPEEDAILKDYLEKNGNGGNWISFPAKAGLKRCGKSCRLRWWAAIAANLPGRTDNDVKNRWNSKLRKVFEENCSGSKTSQNIISNNHSTTNHSSTPPNLPVLSISGIKIEPYDPPSFPPSMEMHPDSSVLIDSSASNLEKLSLPLPKVEVFDPETYLSLPPSMEMGYQEHSHPTGLLLDRSQFSPPSDVKMEVPDFGKNGCSSSGISSSQEMPTLSSWSASWPDGGDMDLLEKRDNLKLGQGHGFTLEDFGFDPCHVFLDDLGFEEQCN
ncbi:hypothetical protein Tsubulata_033400 [Turnera subulata]|uniref:Uncharacterized protein n=1 Tax=Turnera subulata TaxID=218843 RepID=A0A9Q0GAV0_9ROSI|nr:hypothetical protein Tsubulata_033400 [Turnera subulata]